MLCGKSFCVASTVTFHALWASVLPRAQGASRGENTVVSLRGRQDIKTHRNTAQGPGSDSGAAVVSGHYFGLGFKDNPFAVNVWEAKRSNRLIDDLNPTAPFDRMDKVYIKSWTGEAAVEPGKTEAGIGYTKPDYVPPYLHPKPFPDEAEQAELLKRRNGIIVPIEDREVVAHEDRLRNPRAPWYPLNMYPLVAPADKLDPGPWPVANLDRIPHDYNRFFTQDMQREASVKKEKELLALFKRVDKDSDNSISPEEYDAEVKGRQHKTDDQTQSLWKQYHITPNPDMNKEEFMKMAATGFDLGQSFVPRTDIAVVLRPPQTADMGYWGGGAACKNGSYITSVQTKTAPGLNTGDNTALNGVKFKCSDGQEIKTAEGEQGAWTEAAACLPDQMVYSVTVRVAPYRQGMDNTGINDLMFKCRSPGQDKTTTLMFGENLPVQDQSGYVFVDGKYIRRDLTTADDKQVVVGKGKVAVEGGWSDELTCGSNGALCGAQARILNEPKSKDNMGVTDFRFFCCPAPLDCSAPCANPSSTACFACKSRQSLTSDQAK